MIVPGLVHDHCSAFHPIAAASPFLAELDLAVGRASRGCSRRWTVPIRSTTVRPACCVDRSSGPPTAWGATVSGGAGCSSRLASRFDDLFADASQPVLRVPRHPLTLARFGAGAMLPATAVGSAVADGAGQGALGRRRRPRLHPPRPADDQRRRADADRRRTRRGLGGGRRRLAGDRRGAGGRHRTPRRQDRDRRARDLGRRPAAAATC